MIVISLVIIIVGIVAYGFITKATWMGFPKCTTSDWSVWGACTYDEESRMNQQTRTRNVDDDACTWIETTQKRKCNLPIDCETTEWQPYTRCISGKQMFVRDVLTYPMYGGRTCGALTEARSC